MRVEGPGSGNRNGNRGHWRRPSDGEGFVQGSGLQEHGGGEQKTKDACRKPQGERDVVVRK